MLYNLHVMSFTTYPDIQYAAALKTNPCQLQHGSYKLQLHYIVMPGYIVSCF